MRHLGSKLALGALSVGMLTAVPSATAFASGPPVAATAFATAVITPNGGSVSGFGITATFAKGAVVFTRAGTPVPFDFEDGLYLTPLP